MSMKKRKINKNQVVFIGFAIVIAWALFTLLVNNEYLRQNVILMNLPIFVGYALMGAMTLGKETQLFVRWLVAFILAICATWLTAIVVNVLFVVIYGIQWT